MIKISVIIFVLTNIKYYHRLIFSINCKKSYLKFFLCLYIYYLMYNLRSMSLSFRIRGSLYKKEDIQIISEGFKKRVFILEVYDNPVYKDYLSFALIQEKCSFVDGFNIGDFLIVDFNIKGREYKKEGSKDRYFITLQAWRVSKDETTASLDPNNSNVEANSQNSTENNSMNEEDDLPF